MWFFGFSTTNPRNLWAIGAIILVILFTVILMKWAIYLGSDQQGESNNNITAQTIQGEDDCSMNMNIKNGCCHCSSSVIRTHAVEELKVATRDFRFRIGVGATSYVYLAELGERRFGAVKRVMEERGGTKKIFLDEVSVLLRISHPNLVGLLGFCLERGLKSLQGSMTLPEWTEAWRRSKDSEVLMGMLDPKLNGSDVNLEQLRVLVDVANSAPWWRIQKGDLT
ncbi:hypothetical protein Vadar_033829 [Vaccinium darrowii]|uniref:Uncharacterized protein n=1 Tax=Vaccinium darrowii TaxID=229202 RepID=A0ACB7ZFU2_9ERIC|nr:hypothetical protein Vadar_033829 [Vaccinium darrowii]